MWRPGHNREPPSSPATKPGASPLFVCRRKLATLGLGASHGGALLAYLRSNLGLGGLIAGGNHVKSKRSIKCSGFRNAGQAIRRLAPFVVLSALLTQSSYAQQLPESARQKAEEASKKAYQKDTDEAYKAAMKRTRDANKKVDDPWGSVRTHSRRNRLSVRIRLLRRPLTIGAPGWQLRRN